MSTVSSSEPKLREALVALKQYFDAQQAAKAVPDVIAADSADVVTLCFRLASIPKKKQIRFESVRLPHPLVNKAEVEVCLIVRDPKEAAEKKVETAGVKVAKVLAVKSLKKKYKSPESRRDLCNKFDVFLAEEEVAEMLPTLLGRYFYDVKRHKIPSLISSITKSSYDAALESTRFRLSTGATLGVRIGKLESMSVEEMLANAKTVIPEVEKFLLRKGNGVIGFDVQVTDGVALPVYVKKIEEKPESIKKAITSVKRPAPESEDSDVEQETKSLASLSVKDLKKISKTEKKSRKL